MPPWWVCLRHPKSPNVQLSAKHDLGPLNGSTDSEQGSRWSDPPSRTPLLKVVKHFFGLGVAKGGLISGSFSLWLKPKKRCQFTLVSIFSLGGYCSKELFGTYFWRFEANCLRLIHLYVPPNIKSVRNQGQHQQCCNKMTFDQMVGWQWHRISAIITLSSEQAWRENL